MSLTIGDEIRHESSEEPFLVTRITSPTVHCIRWDAFSKKILPKEFLLNEIVKA